MSQLNVDSIKDRTGANQPDIVGAAKAFVNFNGTGTVAIRNGFNVSSITDNGTGDYTVNFTTAMPDTSFSGVALADAFRTRTNVPSNSSVYNVETWNSSGVKADSNYVNVTIHR